MDTEFNKEIGARIRSSRTALDLTREKLAEKADISVQFLSDIESGKKGMSVVTLKKLCKALSVSSDYLIFGKASADEAVFTSETLSRLPIKQRRAVEEIVKIILKSF